MADDAQREAWRRARANYRERHKDERCTRCARKRNLPGKWCDRCLAWSREKELPGVAHDRRLHMALLRVAANPEMRCRVSGFSNAELSVIGERLEIDRIEPYRGYVAGNVQIIASSLNRAKGRALEVPDYAVDALRYALEGPTNPEARIMAGLPPLEGSRG